MTSYTIEVGYNSSYDRDEVGKKILAVVADLRANPPQTPVFCKQCGYSRSRY